MKVYCIENKLTGKKYIGVTKGEINRRYKQHKQIAKNPGSPKHCYIHSAMLKHGLENFIVYQLDEANTKEELFEKEKIWIKKLDTKLNGYNETDGGEGTFGWKPTEEQNKQNSERIKKVMQDENHRKLLAEKSKSFWNNLTEEEKNIRRNQFNLTKIGNQNAKGKTWKLSAEAKRKISISKKGRIVSDETKKKLSENRIGEKNHRYGKKHSPETIEKMRQAALNRKRKQERVGT